MKLRNQKYLSRKKAITDMIRFKNLQSFLKATLALSKSMVVRKDMRDALWELESRPLYVKYN
jgi:hypothetical protein